MTEITYKSTMDVELVGFMGSDETVARAARVSTGRDQLDQGKIEGLIGYLMRSGHSSCFEHCTLTVRVHVPIFVHRQLMTHRTLAKNSESGRYKELEPVFYVPSEDRPLVNAGSGAYPNLVHEEPDPRGSGMMSLSEFTQDLHRDMAEITWDYYGQLIQEGVATEVARNILPVSIYTSAYLTGNLLAWFNFLRLRDGSHGSPQHEIQEVAKKVALLIEEHYPITFAAWKATQSAS